MPVTINPTSITFNDGSVQSSAASTGFNTVGSYVFGGEQAPISGGQVATGGTIAAGNGYNQVQAGFVRNMYSSGTTYVGIVGGLLSGTWRKMGYGGNVEAYDVMAAIFVRIS
jgi:hypothetical protein